MIIQRRQLLIGLASAFAAPAIVRVDSIMPVRTFVPRVLRWQSWPSGSFEGRPREWAVGTMAPGRAMPLSYYLRRMEQHRRVWPDLTWKFVDN